MRGAHKHTKFHLVTEDTDESKCVATIGWVDNEKGFRATNIEVEDGAPADVRDALGRKPRPRWPPGGPLGVTRHSS